MAQTTETGTGHSEQTFRLRIIREPGVTTMTPRKREVCWTFGIPPREEPFAIAEGIELTLRPGTILLITGPSGSGKTSILHDLAQQAGDVHWVGKDRFSPARSIIDSLAPRAALTTAAQILTTCGLGEPRLWLRSGRDISEGEQFRASLARALARSLTGNRQTPILCDEFTTILHPRAARAIAYNFRRLVTRARLTLVAATTREDIIDDLQPDQILCLGGPAPQITQSVPRNKAISLKSRAVIEPGSVRDYRSFAPLHYRHHDGLGFVDKVFLLREPAGGDPLGILVFAHAPMELALRNHATNGRFIRNLRRLNRELRILRRLVIHPDVRGCGLGHWFVAQTLPRVGVRFVECLAAMGAVNPVFEKAGMTRIGQCPLPRGRLALVERLRKWKLDPFADDFHRRIARLPRVREMVQKTVQDWIGVTHGARQTDITSHAPHDLARSFRQIIGNPPMYYLWDRDGEFPRSVRRPCRRLAPMRGSESKHHPDKDPEQRRPINDESPRDSSKHWPD